MIGRALLRASPICSQSDPCSSIFWVRRENRQFGCKATIIHLEYGFDHERNVFSPEFSWIFLLRVSGCRGETRQHFAGIDQKHTDVVLAEFRAPALGHSSESEFARVIRRAVGRAPQARGGTNIDNVAAVPLDEMFRGFAGHQHGSGHIRGKDGFKTRAVHIDEFPEDARAGIIHKNVQFGECLKDFAVRPNNVGFVCNIGPDRNRMQHLGRFVQLLFIPAGDGDAVSCINKNFGDSESDSAAAACDECRSVPQVHAEAGLYDYGHVTDRTKAWSGTFTSFGKSCAGNVFIRNLPILTVYASIP